MICPEPEGLESGAAGFLRFSFSAFILFPAFHHIARDGAFPNVDLDY